MMNAIDVEKLKFFIENKESIQLIDIREDYELQTEGTLNGLHIPMGELMHRLNELKEDVPVVFHCRSGKRSANILTYMKMNGLYKENYYNLEGGIVAWKEKFGI